MGRFRLIISSVTAVLLGIGLLAAPLGAAAMASPVPRGAVPGPNVVAEWALIVQTAIHNPGEPRGVGSSYVLHTITQLAVYDAVMAIEGGFEPFHAAPKAAEDADVRAAVATAAYRATRGRVAASQFGYLDDRYGTYMATIPDGAPKQHGIEVGEAAAADILALRANDGFSNTVTYECTGTPLRVGEFEPDGGCGTQPLETKLAQVTPFTFSNPAQFRPDGPSPNASDQWAADLDEVKAYGAANSTVRTAEQTDVAYFWSEHGYVHWNRNIANLAIAKGLGVAETARLLAMLWTAMSDTVVAGIDAKYFYRYWRPRTAIPRAAEDDNPKTIPDPTWTPLLSVNHPEYPSGHGFITGAMVVALTAFFGTDQLEWTIETSKTAVPKLVRTQRTYPNLGAIAADINNARVWAGLHFRNSTTAGYVLGTRVGQQAIKDRFRPVAARPLPAQQELPAQQKLLPRTGFAPLAGLLAVFGLGLTAAGVFTHLWARGGSCRSPRRGSGGHRRVPGRWRRS
jgi:hypothetical protein